MLVLDDQGESMMRVVTPQPASGVCFGGTSANELLITAGDAVWSLRTTSQVRSTSR